MESDIQSALARFFRDELNVDVPSASTDLIDAGILDSLMLIEVVMFMETEFSVTAEFDDLDMENFVSVDCMTRFVMTRQQGAVAGEQQPPQAIDTSGS